jgi:hypothetical protein
VRTEFRNLFIGRESVTFRDFGNQATLAVFDARFHEFFARNRNVEAGPCGIKNSLQPDDIFAAVAGLPGNLKLTVRFLYAVDALLCMPDDVAGRQLADLNLRQVGTRQQVQVFPTVLA